MKNKVNDISYYPPWERRAYGILRNYLVKNSDKMFSPLPIEDRHGEIVGWVENYEFGSFGVQTVLMNDGSLSVKVSGEYDLAVRVNQRNLEKIIK